MAHTTIHTKVITLIGILFSKLFYVHKYLLEILTLERGLGAADFDTGLPSEEFKFNSITFIFCFTRNVVGFWPLIYSLQTYVLR